MLEDFVALAAYRTAPIVTAFIDCSLPPSIAIDHPGNFEAYRSGTWWPASSWYVAGDSVYGTNFGGIGTISRLRYQALEAAIVDPLGRPLPAFDLPTTLV